MICLKPTFFFRLSAKEVDELTSWPIQQAGVYEASKLEHTDKACQSYTASDFIAAWNTSKLENIDTW